MSKTYPEFVQAIQSTTGSEADRLVEELRNQVSSDYHTNMALLKTKENLFKQDGRNYEQELQDKIAIRKAAISDDQVFGKLLNNVGRFEGLLNSTRTEGLFMDTAATMFFICGRLKEKALQPQIS